MTTHIETVRCPSCGAPMNCHAEKPAYPTSDAEARAAAEALGFVIAQVHLCPRCGVIEVRRVNA